MSHFTYTDDDLECAALALLKYHDNPIYTFPPDERAAAFANAESDVQVVLRAVGGEWVETP